MIIGGIALTAVILVGARAQAGAARTTWGDTVEVLVAAEAVGSGEPLIGRTELVSRPAAFVPGDVVRHVLDDAEHAARSLEPGEVITARDLAGSGHAVRLADGQRAVSLPLGPGIPSLNVGDRVELYVVFDSFGDRVDDPERIDAAVVVELGERDVTLAVDKADVAMLARASTSGEVIVARR